MPAGASQEYVRAWDPHVPGLREVFHARFVDHAYPPHTHAAWTVLIVDTGAVRYALDRHEHGALGRAVTVLPPHVTHDGRSATAAGFVKRVLYLDPDVVGDHLIGRAVDRPTIVDAALVRGVRRLHGALRRPPDALEAETRLAMVAERLAAQLAGRPGDLAGGEERGAVAGRHARALAAALRDLLDAEPFAPATLRTLAAQVGSSPTHLARCFTATFGVPPHTYLVGRRVEAARHLLLEGRRPAEVAALVGFHDQAHMTRHFRRHVGTTPGRYGRTA